MMRLSRNIFFLENKLVSFELVKQLLNYLFNKETVKISTQEMHKSIFLTEKMKETAMEQGTGQAQNTFFL